MTAYTVLFLFSNGARTILLAVLPLEALERLGSAQAVSAMYVGVSIGGIAASLMLPAVVARLSVRGTFYAAATASCLAALLLTSGNLWLFMAGMVLYVAGGTGFEVALSLYTMKLIPRKALMQVEPWRVLFCATSYCLGPWLGVYLGAHLASWAPYALTLIVAAVAVTYFHLLGLTHISMERAGTGSNPLRHARRFVRQPRLRLAWLIAFSRSAWWAGFFIYAPIMAVSAGLDKVTAGAIVSLGVATVLTVTLWGKLGRRIGLRRLLIGGFCVTGVVSVAIALMSLALMSLAPLSLAPLVLAGALVFAAACAASIDGAGNVPFLRAVKPSERAEMAGVFGTFRDIAQLAPPLMAAGILQFFPLPAVFAATGVGLWVTAAFCRYLPRRM